jgi:hypothetical protein
VLAYFAAGGLRLARAHLLTLAALALLVLAWRCRLNQFALVLPHHGSSVPGASYTVAPQELTREKPYLADAIASTRRAFALDAVRVRRLPSSGRTSGEDLAASRTTIANVPLWDDDVLRPALDELQSIGRYYSFPGTAGLPIKDPQHYGDWIADVERPGAQYRGRYQLHLDEARELLSHAAPPAGGRRFDAAASGSNEVQVLPVVRRGR